MGLLAISVISYTFDDLSALLYFQPFSRLALACKQALRIGYSEKLGSARAPPPPSPLHQ